MRTSVLVLAALLLPACKQKPEDSDTQTEVIDADNDGYSLDADCDDSDPAVNAGAEEECDGIDNNCDQQIDEGLPGSTWYLDGDGDGYGTDATTVEACAGPEGYVADGGDCDDTDTAWHPNATEDDCTDPNDYNCDGSVGAVDGDGDGYFACEECDDGNIAVNPTQAEICNDVDDNCDGVTDTDAVDAGTWYYDVDADGYGDDTSAITTCDQPKGTVEVGGDCDDTDTAYNPGAPEVCNEAVDYNCDGSVGFDDADGDGVAACDDCDDTDATAYPGAPESCDGVDDDCDGTADDDATDALIWYADTDGDGYGDPTLTQSSCTQPKGYVATGDDCDDTDLAYNPAASEACDDPADYNCDGAVGYADGDGDGVAACEDCDDTDPSAGPDFEEVCDGVDNNCDSVIDEDTAVGAPTWYADVDGDGYGDDGATTVSCAMPEGFVALGGDCDDADAGTNPGADEACTDAVDLNCDGSVAYADEDGDGWAACEECDDAAAEVHPGVAEVCDGVDNDCNGDVDEAGAEGETTWWFDADNDGYGDDGVSVVACEAPASYVDLGGDCDDASPLYNPGAAEDCDDTVDFNCDGSIAYADADGDGYAACNECDDGDASANPSAVEQCDAIDNDCDGNVDEAGASGETTWYPDGDADGYGDAAGAYLACDPPIGFVGDDSDCDDSTAAAAPGNDEVCDFRDNDCDGTTDVGATDALTFYTDGDSDGYGDAGAPVEACTVPSGAVEDDTDCDDGDDAINPGAEELCDGTDQDCDGSVDEDAVGGATWYADADVDGYGDPSDTVEACDAPVGYVANDEDCAPEDGDAYPGALEWCDGEDDDCDGTVDDDASDSTTWYADTDGDGFGDTDNFVEACEMPSGYLADYTDCDDDRAAVSPDGTETCNGLDDDCSGDIDDNATDAGTWYLDADDDGYGTPSATQDACDAPDGYAATSTDCDDAAATVHPGASETCNDTDDDCDGSTDESAVDRGTWYVDADGDGYGTSSSTLACDAPSGYAADDGDCDDAEVDANPGLAEVCNDLLDNDCDGTDNGCSISGAITSASADWTLSGVASNDYLGSAVALGDVDGDGLDDTIVGAYGWDSAGSGSRVDGRVYIHFAPTSSSDTPTTADVVVSGTEASEGLGQSLAFLGDTDGDGIGDYALGAYKHDGAATDAGSVFVFTSQPTGSVNDTSADTTIRGVSASDWAGCAVTAAGDVNDDGNADLLVSANQANVGAYSDAGAVGLFYGPFTAGNVALNAGQSYFQGRENNEQIGIAQAGGGDYDGDGYDDVAIGAYLSDSNGTDAGAVYVFFGPTTSGSVGVASADVRLTGASAGDQLGRSVGFADTDGDGSADLLVGADFVDNGAAVNSGTAYVFASGTASGSATTAAASFTGVTGSDYVGRTIAGSGDVNGDAYEDMIVAATGFDNGATSGVGATYLLYGPFSGAQSLSSYDARIRGVTAADALGYAVTGGGDVNADGFADFFTTSIAADGSALSNNGTAYLFLGGGY